MIQANQPDARVDSFFDVFFDIHIYTVDSFFDIFTELQESTARSDSFFDVFFDVFQDTPTQSGIDSFFDIFTELQTDVDRIDGHVTVLKGQAGGHDADIARIDTEILSMDLRGESCTVGMVVTGINPDGTLLCVPDIGGSAAVPTLSVVRYPAEVGSEFHIEVSRLSGEIYHGD